MKQPRSTSYIGTFVNNVEGLSSYKLTIKHIRQVVNGGRFMKMFRGPGTRSFRIWKSVVNPNGFKYYSGSSRKEGATHFDVYLLGCYNNKTGRYENPKFYNFELK
jgi:hypothetical protein